MDFKNLPIELNNIINEFAYGTIKTKYDRVIIELCGLIEHTYDEAFKKFEYEFENCLNRFLMLTYDPFIFNLWLDNTNIKYKCLIYE